MSALDAVLLFAAIAAALWVAWSPPSIPRRLALGIGAALVTLIAAQLALEGWLYHLAPVWLLVGLFALATAWPARGGAARWTVRAAAVASSALAILPWLVAPAVPVLPRPSGPYAVGSRVFRWVDPSRPELARPGERRGVVAQLWYPTEARGPGRRLPYIDGLGRLPSSVSGLPSQLLRTSDRIDTHALADAPLSAARRWPLLLFSPGAGAPRAFYAGLLADLASRGVVVAAVDHPYDSAVVQLADGRIATDAHRFGKVAGDPVRAMAFMADEQAVRAADMAFTLDQLRLEPTYAGLDFGRVIAAGHSFGGASAIELWARDNRIAAAVNLDGTLYGDPAAGHARAGQVVVVQSDEALTRHAGRYAEGLARLSRGLRRAPEVVTIPGASHISFTDAPAFLTWLVRLALPRLFGAHPASDVQRLAASRIAALVGVGPPSR